MKKHLLAQAKEHDELKKCHAAMSASCKELSACYKAEVAEGLRKASEKDHYADLGDAHKSASECHGRLGDNCRKAAALPAKDGGDGMASDEETNANGDASAKAATAAIDALRVDFTKKLEEFGKQIVPTGVHGALPDIPGARLIGRAGGPTPASEVTPEVAEILGPM